VSVRFAEDGSPILGTNTSSTGAEKMQRDFRLDLATGRIQQWSGKSMPPADSDAKEEEEVLPVKLETTQAAAKDANGVVTLRMLWLTARNARPAQRALVAIEAEDGRILPGCTGILYRAKGALWIAPVVRVDIETFQRARTEYLRIILRSDARWINAALRDWARKHGDSFPPPQDLAKDLSPYIELAEAISKVRNYCDVMQE
jgi:hypothetical protein